MNLPPHEATLLARSEDLAPGVGLDASRYGNDAASTVRTSIVAPAFNEEEGIAAFVRRTCGVMRSLAHPFELIVVNDGSSDGTAARLDALAGEFPELVIAELSRNFGQQAAYCAGIDLARGRNLVMMDADLQDPPEAIPRLLAALDAGSNIATAARAARQEGPFKRFVYWAFYRVLGYSSNIPITLDAGDFCAMDPVALGALRRLPERTRFLRGLRSWIGLRHAVIPIEREKRVDGASKYTMLKLLRLGLDGLLSFGTRPLRVVIGAGVCLAVIALLAAVFYTYQRLWLGLNPPGFPTVIVALCFFSGVQLLTLGLIGEYLGRVFDEVKARPVYIISRLTRNARNDPPRPDAE